MTPFLRRCSWSTTLSHSNGTKWLSIIQAYIQGRLCNAHYHLLPVFCFFHSSGVWSCLSANNRFRAWLLPTARRTEEESSDISVAAVLGTTPSSSSGVCSLLWYTLKRAASPRAVSLILLEAHWEAVAIPAGARSGESPFGRGNYDYNLKSRIFNGLVWRILKGPIGVKRNRK